MLVGIVGKANVGKSTFFKALTAADILIANYPFATIKPNHGIAFAKIDCVCKELGVQCNPRVGACINNKRFVPVEILDVAGLVPGAHEGKGKGNQFLDDLRQADVFLHVVDMAGSTNEKGEPSEGHDPAFDIRFLEEELDMWIVGLLKKNWDRFVRQVQQEHGNVIAAISKQLSGLKITEGIVKKAIEKAKLDPQNLQNWTDEGIKQLANIARTETKPMLIISNKMDLPSSQANLERCRKEFPNYLFVPVSGDSELALKEAANKKLINYVPGASTFEIVGEVSDKQKAVLEFIKKNVLEKYSSTGVQNAIDTAVFELLKYIAIFPGSTGKLGDKHGNILPDCFLLPPNSTALDFANKIHSDLARDFVAAIDVKSKRRVGKDSPLKHRDVVEILTKK